MPVLSISTIHVAVHLMRSECLVLLFINTADIGAVRYMLFCLPNKLGVTVFVPLMDPSSMALPHCDGKVGSWADEREVIC